MRSLKYLLVISLVALPLVASACWHPWTIYNNTSIFRLDNSKSESRNIREANCRQWQQLTDCNIPLQDIEKVVYTMPIEEYEQFCAAENYCGDNAFAQWIKRHDSEIMEFLLLAKRNESIRLAYSSRWYYPTMKLGGPMTIEEIAEQAMVAKSERLRDRYLLQAVRALTTLGRYKECIELWNNEISFLPKDNLMRGLCNQYIGGAYYHTGDVDSAMMIFASRGDFNSMYYIARMEGLELSDIEIIEYCYRAGASLSHNHYTIRSMVVSAETWPVVDVIGDKPIVNDKLVALRDLAIEASNNAHCADRAEWGYISAYIYMQEGKYADAKRLLSKAQSASATECMKESMETLAIYIDALSSTHDVAYEARLHKQMLWLEERWAKQIKATQKNDNYYWMGYGEFYWYNTIARIVSYTAAERYMKEGDAVRALQLKNYVEYVGYKWQPVVHFWSYNEYTGCCYEDYDYIDVFRRNRGEFNYIDYSNNFFENFDKQTPDVAIAYVNRALNPVTEFDRYLNDVGYTSSDFLYDVVGTLCLRYMRYAEAEYYLSLVSTDYEKLLNVELKRDPFRAHSEVGNPRRDFRYLFASTMASLERSIETTNDPNRRAQLLLKYGIGMANSVNTCWPLTRYGILWDAPWHEEPITKEVRNKGIACVNEALALFTDREALAEAHYALGSLYTVVTEFGDTETAKYIHRHCDTFYDYRAPLFAMN